MSGLRLPTGLLDLVLAHTFPATRQISRRSSTLLLASVSNDAVLKRYAYSAVALLPQVDPALDPSLLITERKNEKQTLSGPLAPRNSGTKPEEYALRMKRMGDEQTGLLPSGLRYSEEEIMAVYEDLLANPSEETVEAKEDVEVSPTEIVSETIRRLSSEQLDLNVGEEAAVHRVLIERLEQLANEASEERAESREVAKVMSEEEWQALVQTSLDAGDVTSTEQVLGLMHRLQSPPSEDCLNLVLAFHANNGDIQKADHFIKNSLTEVPTPLQRDLHIKAHLTACRTTSFPTPALHLLHTYELQNLSPPQKTYARLISHLLHAGTSIAHAHAWDLFAHMRYVAHPTPDSFLYTTMIKACSSSPSSSSMSSSGEPERALDLWTEMTVDKRIEPTAEAYCATILACARSGRREYVYEGFRLAKEMMDGMRDARGRARWMPGERFFGALLQGAKRIGDLGRVRWILAEMVRGSLGMGGEGRGREEGERGVRVGEGAVVRENVMVHVFHAYASYKPPFKRSMAVVVDGEGEKGVAKTKDGNDVSASGDVEQTQEDGGDVVPEEPEHISFAQVPPQTHGEIIQEAEALFARILADQPSSSPHSHESEDSGTAVFRHVQITPRLVNAYLSVHYAHSRVDAWRELAMTLHERVGVRRNAFFYVEVLERCGSARRGVERGDAVGLAEGLWGEWVEGERAWREGKEGMEGGEVEGIAPRLVERVHSAMIRMLSLTRQLDRALDLVRDFVQTYPPSAIRTTVERPSLLSTRTSLVGARPLIRLMSSAEVPDDTVPPLLTFTEVEALHHRLVAARREKDIKYLKWVCKSYEGALRARRDAVMRAQPATGEEEAETEEGKADDA